MSTALYLTSLCKVHPSVISATVPCVFTSSYGPYTLLFETQLFIVSRVLWFLTKKAARIFHFQMNDFD